MSSKINKEVLDEPLLPVIVFVFVLLLQAGLGGGGGLDEDSLHLLRRGGVGVLHHTLLDLHIRDSKDFTEFWTDVTYNM